MIFALCAAGVTLWKTIAVGKPQLRIDSRFCSRSYIVPLTGVHARDLMNVDEPRVGGVSLNSKGKEDAIHVNTNVDGEDQERWPLFASISHDAATR